jgi:hypothetical protein
MIEDQVHPQEWLPLNNLNEGKELMKAIRQVLDEILTNPERICPNCGGIRPEIVFKYKDHNYFFTCWKIKKKNKVIAETDYKKVAKYESETSK